MYRRSAGVIETGSAMNAPATYFRPIGRITLPPSRINAPPNKVVRIGQRDDVVFSALELIQRHPDGLSDRRILSPDDASRLVAQPGPAGDRLKTISARFASPRGAIGGLPLDRPRIMGIVNVTPDSFAADTRHRAADDAIRHALRLEAEGADILDIGGESTRPGADPVPVDEELRRVLPVIEALVGRTRARLSIDTRKAEVMRRAAAAGVHILNDVSALTHDPLSLRVATDTRLPVVLMHAQGDPRTMQNDPRYDNAMLDVYDYLEARVEACVRAGIPRERLIVDPGIGFGKNDTHNTEIIAGLSLYHGIGTTVLLGASRKRFIGSLTGALDPAERIPGSIAAALIGADQGAQILRVHDVAETRQALTIWESAVKA
jgi:dihydropteroate synthase